MCAKANFTYTGVPETAIWQLISQSTILPPIIRPCDTCNSICHHRPPFTMLVWPHSCYLHILWGCVDDPSNLETWSSLQESRNQDETYHFNPRSCDLPFQSQIPWPTIFNPRSCDLPKPWGEQPGCIACNLWSPVSTVAMYGKPGFTKLTKPKYAMINIAHNLASSLLETLFLSIYMTGGCLHTEFTVSYTVSQSHCNLWPYMQWLISLIKNRNSSL